ncbi:MAG: hypothetical protein IPM95_05100 [Sphingobacteriales bacterium]|nr:hypothetical protein [Sphingobacteriales bacterium]
MPEVVSLNIICFDVPLPADYGGAIEEFYKLKSLYRLGVKIHLHCFVYGERKPQPELEKYCEKIFYYERKRRLKDIFTDTPFVVKSRKSEDLLRNLLSNDFPILFDATHTTGFISHPAIRHRKKIVRLHNIEWMYYSVLFHSAITLKERIFYFTEYKKLRRYDKNLVFADVLSCLSITDTEYYKDKFPNKEVSFENVFHQNETVECLPGKGDYLLYHGNLSILDNYMLVIDLLNHELKDCRYPVVLAGKKPDELLLDFVKDKPNIRIVSDPSDADLKKLIQGAHICLALAANPSGVKLKLINSLYSGRFVFVNDNALHGNELSGGTVNISENFNSATIGDYMQKTFTEEDIGKRKDRLYGIFDNLKNAEQLLNRIVN